MTTSSPPDRDLPASAGTAQPLSLAQIVYVWLAATAATCLVVADIVGVKLFTLPLPFVSEVRLPWQDSPITAIVHTCGMLTFPLTFILTDVLNEFYGKRAARRVVYLSFAMALLAFLVLNIAQVMPPLDAPYNVRQEAFDHIFGSAKVMYIASLTAYMVGSLSDILFFAWFKRKTNGRHVWLRATGSTVVSQFLDSFIVTFVAFSLGRRLFPVEGLAPMTMPEVLATAGTGYLLKFCIAIAATPVIYAIKAVLSKHFGLRPLPPEPVIG